jgi:transmembrane sensor
MTETQIEDFLVNDSFQRFVFDQNIEDVEYWQHWLNEHPENEKVFEQAVQLAQSLKHAKKKKPDFNIDIELGKLLNTIQLKATRKTMFFNADHIIWKMAAILVIAFGLGWYLKGSPKLAKNSNAITFSIIKVPLGAKSNIELPDGTKVCLNAGSTLKYSSDYNSLSRDIYLEGEAFFDVKKKPEMPFNVRTSEIDIKVLGTAFNVKAYPDEATIETTIIRGTVNIVRAGSTKLEKAITLGINQKATFVKGMDEISLSKVDSTNQKGKTNSKKNEMAPQILPLKEKLKIDDKADVNSLISWTNGILVFKSEPLESIAKKLERKYDVSVIFENEGLKKSKYTGLLRDLTLEQVLEVIEFTSPIQFKIKERTVYIKSK